MRARLFKKRDAYRAVFRSGDALGPMGEIVMRDLAHFCYANRPTPKISRVTQQVDPVGTAIAEGRREVYLRIVAMLNLSAEEVERIAIARTQDE